MSYRNVALTLALLLTLTALQLPLQTSAAPVGLVAAYNFDQGSGATLADQSGTGNNGSLANTTWSTSGKFGSALSFNGTNSLVTIADSASLDLTNGMTIEAWVRPASLSGWKTVVMKENGTNLAYALSANNNNANSSSQRPVSRIRIGSSTKTVTGTAKLPLNAWTHLATTYDGVNQRLYVNGILVSTVAVTGNINVSASPLRLGGTQAFSNQYYSGMIDEVRIYNRALSGTEIQTDMNTPVTPDSEAPLVTLSTPLEGAALSGSVAVTASSSDNIAVSGVQFMLDGANLGAEDLTAPYSTTWDTHNASNTAHVLTARARDAAGNATVSAPVNVTVYNAPILVITSPTSGQSIASTTVPVTYTTQGDLALSQTDHVHFRLDNNSEVMDLNFDGVYQFNNVPGGSHTLNGYLAKADHSKVVGSDAVQIAFTTVTPDTEVPVVSITTPLNNSTTSGTLSFAATATDNVGVVGVQFLVDGTNLGSEDTSAPYAVSWNTALMSNGLHTLTATARDASANVATSSPVVVSVANNNDPSSIGQWGTPSTSPIIGVHGILMKTSKVILWPNGAEVEVWNPATDTYLNVPNTHTNIFCGAHISMADGRVYAVGGGGPGPLDAVRTTDFFDPISETWSAAGSMNIARWYPTITMLGDGRVLATSGSNSCVTCYILTPEIYNPVSNTWTLMNTSANSNIPMYPFMYVMPDGRVLQAGASEYATDTKLLDVNTQTWTTIDSRIIDGGSAVTYAPGKVMKAGSASDSGFTGNSTSTTFVLDMNLPSPAWRKTAPMQKPRSFLNLTLLPDGTTLATGGDTTRGATSFTTAVKEAEIWSPATETWSTMASMQIPRLYHSIALLLPDGRVLVTGGGQDFGVPDSFQTEIYSPPYLFKGARPVITSAPATLNYGSTFLVETPDSASIASVSLIKNSAVTHSTNMDQRFMNLPFTQTTGGLLVDAPANSNIATPGMYMLFIVNANGVPSVAPFVSLPSPLDDTQAPSAPSNVVATGNLGSVNLTWTASSDNVGVANYNVYRSTVSGFTPSVSNRIGQPTSAAFLDSGLSAGTYYYQVTAQDARSNLSAPSGEVSALVTADVNAPTVSLTGPAPDVTVSGIVQVTADATDDGSVAGVQFKLDGINLGLEDTTLPYSLSWDTSSAVNGLHTLMAVARDAAGNVGTSTSVSITVSNTAPVVPFAIHASSPARVQGTDPITTAAFNPPDNALILALVSADAATAVDPNVVITNNGAALTWTPIQARSIADSGGLDGEASAFYAKLPTARTGMTVTATVTNLVQSLSMKVYVVTGHDLVSPIGASSEGSSVTNNITPTIYTSTSAGSLGFAVGNDWTAQGLPTSTDEESAFHISTLISGLSAYKASTTSAVGTPVTMNLDAFGTANAKWNWVGFEVKKASGQ